MLHKLFFNENELPLPECLDIDRETAKVIDPIIDRWIKKGYSIRGIENQLTSSVKCRCSIKLLELWAAAAKGG